MDKLDPKNWTDEYVPAPVSSAFDREEFQKKLDEICGTARGRSIIRVVWAAEEEELKSVPGSSIATTVDVKSVARCTTRIKGVPGKVRIRRWLFEEFQPPEQFADPEAFVQMPGKAGLFMPKELANEFQRGRYELLYVVADHSKCIKEICDSEEYFCFGDYREPNREDLAKLRRITERRKAVERSDHFKPLTQSEINLINKRAEEACLEQERAEEAALQEHYTDVETTLAKHSVS